MLIIYNYIGDYNVALYDDHLKITFKKQEKTLRYDQITNVFYGIDGNDTENKKEKKQYYFIISYKPITGEEILIKFEDIKLCKGAKVAKELKELCE